MSNAATADLPYLDALFQHYEMTDCWCGCGFPDVLESYLSDPNMPDVLAELVNDHHSVERYRSFAELARLRMLHPNERRDGLCAELRSLLDAELSDDELARRVGPIDERELAAYSEFWTDDGGRYEGDDYRSEFLRHALRQATAYAVPAELDDYAKARIEREADVRRQFAEIDRQT